MSKRGYVYRHAVWRGITLRIGYARDEWSTDAFKVAHLEIHSIKPKKEPLPITATGYRSHFCNPEDIGAAGGPVAFVLAWLEEESRSAKWRAEDFARRQLSLF